MLFDISTNTLFEARCPKGIEGSLDWLGLQVQVNVSVFWDILVTCFVIFCRTVVKIFLTDTKLGIKVNIFVWSLPATGKSVLCQGESSFPKKNTQT